MNESLRTLISAGVLAPSGDNMQPWKFAVDEAGMAITVYVDQSRDTSPMNAGQRMSSLACGAAIENMAQTAEHNNWEIAVEVHNDCSRIATVHVVRCSSQLGEIPDFIQRRHTNRRLYDGGTSSDSVASLRPEIVDIDADIEIVWVTDRGHLREMANAIGRADAEMFGRAAYFRAFLSNVRFDLPFDAAAEEGLCVGSLELSAFERRVLPLLSHVSAAFLRSWPIRRSFQSKAKRLVNSSMGLCLIVPRRAEMATNYRIGRVMQRAWLHLTKAGYQVQPMMSIPVLLNAGGNGDPSERSLSDILGASALSAFQNLAEFLPAAILRFGPGPAATVRTGRRQFDHVTLTRTRRMAIDDSFAMFS